MLSLNSSNSLNSTEASPPSTPLLNVSDMQYFSVGDGDGIRTTLVLKGCNLRCPWCHNPETISAEVQTLSYGNGKCLTYGRRATAEELFPLLARDAEFFKASGGGVTVSGGEPLLQSRALVPLLTLLRQSGIHVIIDTAASLPQRHIEDVVDLCDCFFVDYKSPRPSVYRDLIGGSLELVEQSIRLLTERGKELHIRIPVIPGVNNGEDDLLTSRDRLAALGVNRVDLLPFHRLGSGKYSAMGLSYPFASTKPPARDEMERAAEIFGQRFTVTIEK